jgi:5'-methylthioinosine phosphorylase
VGKLAVVGGHSVLETSFGSGAGVVVVDAAGRNGTPTAVRVVDTGAQVFLQRHGVGTYVPPHLVDHVANLRALRELGCDRVLALGSVGGLRATQRVGDALAASDYIALMPIGSAFADDRGHVVPRFDPAWRAAVIGAWNDAAPAPLAEECVYWQTTGPRLESPAEIRLMAQHAHVVGMTIASECVAAAELGLAYACVCVVDNLANGLGDAPLTLAEFEAGNQANRLRVTTILDRMVPALT